MNCCVMGMNNGVIILFRYVLSLVLQQAVFHLIQFLTRKRRGSLPPTTPPPTPAAEKETSLVNVRFQLQFFMYRFISRLYCFEIDFDSYF